VRSGSAQRARIVLLAADGVPVKDIVEQVAASKPTGDRLEEALCG
jgi:hypothetical protein